MNRYLKPMEYLFFPKDSTTKKKSTTPFSTKSPGIYSLNWKESRLLFDFSHDSQRHYQASVHSTLTKQSQRHHQCIHGEGLGHLPKNYNEKKEYNCRSLKLINHNFNSEILWSSNIMTTNLPRTKFSSVTEGANASKRCQRTTFSHNLLCSWLIFCGITFFYCQVIPKIIRDINQFKNYFLSELFLAWWRELLILLK